MEPPEAPSPPRMLRGAAAARGEAVSKELPSRRTAMGQGLPSEHSIGAEWLCSPLSICLAWETHDRDELWHPALKLPYQPPARHRGLVI